jgi:hypothetical protein
MLLEVDEGFDEDFVDEDGTKFKPDPVARLDGRLVARGVANVI